MALGLLALWVFIEASGLLDTDRAISTTRCDVADNVEKNSDRLVGPWRPLSCPDLTPAVHLPRTAPSLKVYSSIHPDWGKAFPRIHKALKKFKPSWVHWVDTLEEADVHILHVVEKGALLQMVHPHTVVIQHVTITMQGQAPADLVRLWAAALLVVSFHDLDAFVAHHVPHLQHTVRAYSMPWGVDTSHFQFQGTRQQKRHKARPPLAVITGEVGASESHLEVLLASAAAGVALRHTGLGDTLKRDCEGPRRNPLLPRAGLPSRQDVWARQGPAAQGSVQTTPAAHDSVEAAFVNFSRIASDPRQVLRLQKRAREQMGVARKGGARGMEEAGRVAGWQGRRPLAQAAADMAVQTNQSDVRVPSPISAKAYLSSLQVPFPPPPPPPPRKAMCRNYEHLDFLNDTAFAGLLRKASWVPVLRRWEGFELMGVEALFSGTRPVVFDSALPSQPYRWFKGHAAIVREDDTDLELHWQLHKLVASPQVTAQLTEVFRQPPRPISTEEYQQLVQRFSWEVLVPGLYARIWEELLKVRQRAQQPQAPRPAFELLPPKPWHAASRATFHACVRASNRSLDAHGQPMDPEHCPTFAIILDAADRGPETCQDAALLAARLDGYIVPPSVARDPTFTACGNKTLLLLSPHLYPEIPLRAPAPANATTSLLWVMESLRPAITPLPPNTSLILTRTPEPLPHPQPQRAYPEYLLPPMSMDPRPPSPAPALPNYSKFLLIVTPGSAPLAEAVIHYWARHPVHPLLYVLDPLSALLPTLTAYLTGTAGLPYNATNLVPLPPGPPSPTNISDLLAIGTHIHAIMPSNPPAPNPHPYPHLANLARAAGIMVLYPTHSPELSRLSSPCSRHPTTVSYGTTPMPATQPQPSPDVAQDAAASRSHSSSTLRNLQSSSGQARFGAWQSILAAPGLKRRLQSVFTHQQQPGQQRWSVGWGSRCVRQQEGGDTHLGVDEVELRHPGTVGSRQQDFGRQQAGDDGGRSWASSSPHSGSVRRERRELLWGRRRQQRNLVGEELAAAVRAAAAMTVAQRMLAGQEGQRRYLEDAEAYQQRTVALRYRVQAFAKNGCQECFPQPRH